MDKDYGILEEAALEEIALAYLGGEEYVEYDEYDDEDEYIDQEELDYWAEQRQAEYDEEWGDPLDLPSYSY